MTTLIDNLAFDRGLQPIQRLLTPETARSILDYQPEAELLDKIEQLAEKSSNGELTTQERAEYEGYVRANKLVAILQTKARQYLEQSMNAVGQFQVAFGQAS